MAFFFRRLSHHLIDDTGLKVVDKRSLTHVRGGGATREALTKVKSALPRVKRSKAPKKT